MESSLASHVTHMDCGLELQKVAGMARVPGAQWTRGAARVQISHAPLSFQDGW